MNTESANGKLKLTMLGAITELERNLMLERQREGIAEARARGAEVVKLKAEGQITDAIAEALEISRASVFRILRAHKDL